ncbi:MAG: hypothetical protein NVS1B1_08030 [Candidatus Limnocylindrales bacterium]
MRDNRGVAEDLRYDEDAAFTLADDAATVAALVRRTPDERLRAARFGEWNAKQVIGHLAASAEVFAERVRRCIEEDRPTLPLWDQDADDAAADHTNADPMVLSRRLQAAHAQIVQLLGHPGAAERLGVHAERGPVTAGWIAAYQARHSHEHATELGKAFPPAA